MDYKQEIIIIAELSRLRVISYAFPSMHDERNNDY
jgi:hypothetical protein